MLTPTRGNQEKQTSLAERYRISAVRQIIETVNGQLTEQLHIGKNHAHLYGISGAVDHETHRAHVLHVSQPTGGKRDLLADQALCLSHLAQAPIGIILW